MCANCVTSLDAMAITVVGGTAFASAGLGWVRDRMGGAGAVSRRRREYDDDARFLRSIDLDPVVVLGAPPEPSHPRELTTS
jgi:hypothetical protein